MLIAMCAALAASLAPPPTTAVPARPTVMGACATADEAEASLRKLEQEWKTAQTEYQKLMQGAKPEERKALRGKAPRADEYAPRFLALAEKHPKTAVAERALGWVAKNSRNPSFKSKALGTLIDDHVESELIGDLCGSLTRDYLEGPGLLQRVIDESPHLEVRGRALLALGANLKGAAEIAEGIKAGMRDMYLGWYGQEVVDALAAVDPAELAEDAVKNLSLAAGEYGEVKQGRRNLKEAAKGDLFELQHLWFGMTAPEIEAEDLDGVTFKLSDYRGKVVVLDFWGNW